jgi:hypothetical protein
MPADRAVITVTALCWPSAVRLARMRAVRAASRNAQS